MTDIEDLFEHAPCGYVCTDPDGWILAVNATLLGWLGYARTDLVGRRRFGDLLTVGGRIYHETQYAPLLRTRHEIGGIGLELVAKDGTRVPALVSSTVRTDDAGTPLSIRTVVVDAGDRREYERELLRARQEADRERAHVERLAVTLQRSLLPPVLPEVAGLDIAAHYRHASRDEIGGDFYDVFPLADGRWALFLGDVCGKGAEAAVVTSLTRYALRSAAVYDPDPVAVLANVDSVLHQERTRHCTVLFGLLTPAADGCTLVLAGGGHPPAVVLRADRTAAYVPTRGGQPVGLLPKPRFGTATVHLARGDTIMLYTDGLVEARTGADRYGVDGLLTFATAHAPATAPALVAAVSDVLTAFGDGLQDDAAILALGVRPAGDRG
ncbi:PP2C family protein-serine/threonine phosphatase [Actinophytocola sp.]|uniref:PP2C family protein-serine/threonine phosphatase n=1 Tax=Actinophytocola sp. TaxID=1872138 RepID=UPI003D6C4887